VTNQGYDRNQLTSMALQAKAATGAEDLSVLADRGYFSGVEILACEQAGVTPYVPRPLTSGAKADGRFGKQDFVYNPEQDVYRCPAGERLSWRMTTVENGMTLHRYWNLSSCRTCTLKPQCTPAKARPRAPRHARPTPDRRARLRDPKSLDGRHPLQDQAAEERRQRDEPAGARL